WFKPAQMQGMARVRRAGVLGEFKAAHVQTISVGFDYLTTYTDTASHLFTGLTVGNPTQLRIGPSRQRVEAIRIKVSVTVSGTDAVT
ncbi:hypothetical protein, partial [Propionibacterium freudenreichii]|uniref:hypothetical protein n=1 Tax=Propionibacterium freudenreichii TaxID=1744 RepID=UPI003855374D